MIKVDIEGQSADPKAIVGMMDPSARLYASWIPQHLQSLKEFYLDGPGHGREVSHYSDLGEGKEDTSVLAEIPVRSIRTGNNFYPDAETTSMNYPVLLFFMTALMVQVSIADMSDSEHYVTHCLSFRQAILGSLIDIDEQAATILLKLANPGIRSDDITPLLSSITSDNPAIMFAALISSDGIISHISDDSYTSLIGTHIPYDFPHDQRRPFIFNQSVYEIPFGTGHITSSGRDVIWLVRTGQGIEHLMIHLNDENFGEVAAKRAGLNPDVFAVLMDSDGNVLWCSDYDELNSVPPDNVLTEFPTFRDVKDLVRYTWTGRTVYDVWNSKGIVRTGVWSAVQVYDQVYRVFVAG
ncbi:hypothetical protein Mhun_1430 [Methanospirillum hungatei JF-1]|uniref:Uncharacterized protein n=1 Tax=Methanospirillum hungatei JF-1 (strain ATCC 27890 / DSM 864 / NBRC 100397 / JF-1) TaxID=323259 RepID=Q2FLX4_METHJ|nr:hypothetical protein [Methanospirillum hungatei]ABD41165.1 hypothetical protein Mhun_1430 [Methanospirillum hungatei JF-1]